MNHRIAFRQGMKDGIPIALGYMAVSFTFGIMAKNAGMMARLEKRKKYKSLWDDEEKKEREDPMEAADAEEAFAAGPEVVSVESVMEAATGEMESE